MAPIILEIHPFGQPKALWGIARAISGKAGCDTTALTGFMKVLQLSGGYKKRQLFAAAFLYAR
jgi:hypothetical protein